MCLCEIITQNSHINQSVPSRCTRQCQLQHFRSHGMTRLIFNGAGGANDSPPHIGVKCRGVYLYTYIFNFNIGRYKRVSVTRANAYLRRFCVTLTNKVKRKKKHSGIIYSRHYVRVVKSIR